MARPTDTFPQPPVDRRFSRPIKEMIAIYGDAGTGKTHMALTIAKWHQILGSDRHFYVISTDQGYTPLLMGPDFYDLENITVDEVYDLDEANKAAAKFKSASRPGDWIYADRIDHIWSWAQDEYAQALARKEGSDIENLGDLWKVEGLTGDYPIVGWDWGGINARYRSFRNLLLGSRAHLIVMMDEKPLLRESSSGGTKEQQDKLNTFKHLGIKPTGQKDDVSTFHTFIHVQSPAPKTQHVATAKEKWGNREWLGVQMSNGSFRHVLMDDFFEEYLVKIAGWTTG